MTPQRLAASIFVIALTCFFAPLAQKTSAGTANTSSRPKGPCDIYAAAGDPCVAAHSTTRALYQGYSGPLYQVLRQSDGKTLDIQVVSSASSPNHDAGGYADADAQDAFCRNTYCWISKVYDQSPKHNDLTQAPRGGFSGPAMGGMNNLPLADMAPISVMGHKVYGIFIEPGTGLRIDDPKGTAVDDQAEGQYWVINGLHFNSGCCFDYGNAEIDSRDDDNGTMETAYYGDNTGWIHGNPPGPWIETDQENNLVGCVPTDGSRLCAHLPDIHWRFVTAMAKGEPHHWTSLGGDAQRGALTVMFDGPRVNSSYDPMRKQGAILLGNGGDNSNSSQGTFYEGVVTAAGTFPTDATDQAVQANIVSAAYRVQPLSITPASLDHSTGVQTFALGASKDVTVAFTNVTAAPATSLKLELAAPADWSATVQGTRERSKTFPAVAPGATVHATFTVSAGQRALNGDMLAKATWSEAGSNTQRTEVMAQKTRSAAPVKINEFRVGSGTGNATDSFIELYNSGTDAIDLSKWTLTNRPAQQPSFSSVQIPAGTKLQPKAFYLLGLSNSALAFPAQPGEATLSVRSTTDMSAGDVISVGSGSDAETHRIASVGTAASDLTSIWQPLPDGPMTFPPNSTNVPVQSVSGFKVGEKIALGYGASGPSVSRSHEQYEVATITAVGKPGTQAYLAVNATPGSTNLKVTSVSDISVGDKIRLDIDSSGHGIEIVEVARVGTKASQTNIVGEISAGATRVSVRRAEGFSSGDRISIGTPANMEDVTVSSVSSQNRNGAEIVFAPALAKPHGQDEWVVSPGTGIDVVAPLRFAHAANLPFSDRGTGITFQPATRFPHLTDEPVQALGSGLTLDQPLAKAHAIHAVVRDEKVTTAGYQGTPKPDQWFGGPELVTRSLLFGRMITVREGSMVLRDASGMVVDSLNYGGLVDPWAAKGNQAESGPRSGGCFVTAPDFAAGFGPQAAHLAVNRSAGRFPDGADSDSNCTDFHVQSATVLPVGAEAGATTIKVASVAGFHPGESLSVDTGTNQERGMVVSVGTGGATVTNKATEAGATSLPVTSSFGFEQGQTFTIGIGSTMETASVTSIHRADGFEIVLAAPMRYPHAVGTQVAGTGITLASALVRSHAAGSQVANATPTPGAANQFAQIATPATSLGH